MKNYFIPTTEQISVKLNQQLLQTSDVNHVGIEAGGTTPPPSPGSTTDMD